MMSDTERTEYNRLAIKRLKSDPQTTFTQLAICEKLEVLGVRIAPPTITKLLRGNPLGRRLSINLARGLTDLLYRELGLEPDARGTTLFPTSNPDWQRQPVGTPAAPTGGPLLHPKGRRTLPEKTAFIADAREEVIFFGLRLRQLSYYLRSRRDEEFTDHLRVLLAKGVNVKCYLIDPQSNHASLYLDDIAATVPEEANNRRQLTTILQSLQSAQSDFAAQATPRSGKFSIYTYRHLPTAHFLAVDGKLSEGRIQVAHYLYGQPSSKVPVLEFRRSQNFDLYQLYWNALKALIKDAKEVLP